MKGNNQGKYYYKYLLFLVMLYVCSILLGANGVRKPVEIGVFYFDAGSFFFPFAYVAIDLITEVYGYQVARQLLWTNLVAILFFLPAMYFIVHVHAPATWHHQAAFYWVFGKHFNYLGIASGVGMIFAQFINARLVAQWKVLVRGRYFWLRSMGSSVIGDAIQIAIGLSVGWLAGIWPWHIALMMFFSVLLLRAIYAAVFAFPGQLVAIFLKQAEGVDIYENKAHFSWFQLKIAGTPPASSAS